ncbi:MAG: DUF6788 family protein, partial [Acidobacteriota bacterium]
RCGNPNCRCQKGRRHGPYFYLSVTLGVGKTKTYYVPAGKAGQVRKGIEAYRQAVRRLQDRRFIGLGGLKAPHCSAVAKVCTMISAEVVQEFNGLLVGLAVREKKPRGRRCARTPRWWRPTSTTRRTAACWATGCGCWCGR